MKVPRINLLGFFRAFFPIQLVFSHLKHNIIAVIAWLLFFLIASDKLGSQFGLPILFYSPEYMGEVSNWSFGLLGFGFGGLVMAFNTYSFSKLGKRFPFLVFIKSPFLRFCKNNSLIPIVFIFLYFSKMTAYQWKEEYASTLNVIGYCCSFLVGMVLFIGFSLVYFFPISKKLRHSDLIPDMDGVYPFSTSFRKKRLQESDTHYHHAFSKADRRFLYFGKGFTINISRPVSHIDSSIVKKVLIRNRINTTLFEILTVLFFMSVSLLPDKPIFEIPAAMSIILLVTLTFMVYSMVQTWLRSWTLPFIILIIVGMNLLSQKSNWFSFKNYVYGLNYQTQKKPSYSIKAIETNALQDANKGHSKSYHNYIEILNQWKKKTGQEKPKLIIVNSSGGGLRSTLWTFEILQKLDRNFNGEFKKMIHLYTGASGGMIGSSYFRELSLRAEKGEIKNIYSQFYFNQIGQDMLNRLAFSASTRDLFTRLQKFEYNGISYPKDRGFAFEEQLHFNTNNMLDHTLGYYTEYEKAADIPLLILTPTIVNDGRRLLISSQSLCFLSAPSSYGGIYSKTNENIDYLTFFKDVQPENMRFSSALRASATFPFVTPMVSLPSEPSVQLMDAGIRDNYGVKVTMEILYHIQEWIKENTSGVIILRLRDTKEILGNTTYKQVSLMNKLTMPFGNVYSNFPRTQDFDQDQLLKVSAKTFSFPFDVISFNLRENVNDKISLSWHLSSQEKNKIMRAFYSKSNQESYHRLKKLLVN
ncbi:MAG: patatin-like phospholipase family protein [Crocinitomicaceae bacterium]|nr:patatin-like phospholipase family protein [Crocinitomicaceae bacterium]